MISVGDKQRIRELAKRQLEIAESEKMTKLKKEWLNSNMLRADRPMVTIELGSFAGDVIPDLMQCEGEEARGIEWSLLSNIVNTELFGDDTVVRDYIPVEIRRSFLPFDLPEVVEHPENGGLGHHFKEQILDLKDDFHKLKKSKFGVDLEATARDADYCREVLGDILPVKVVNNAYAASLTQNFLHLMSMETFFLSMYDYPELFKEAMESLSDDYVAHIDMIEKENAFLPMHDSEMVWQGSYAFNDELGSERGTAKNTWIYLDSQETVGVAPEMFKELIFPYYKKIMDRGGFISYGCCEPTDPIWDSCLSHVENLRKVSISPWCNEEYMAEKLKGTKVVYHRKPSPNFIGVGTVLDEDAVRAHISKTVKLNRGRSLEFTQRDVYTINHDIAKVKRYVEIIREECEKNW